MLERRLCTRTPLAKSLFNESLPDKFGSFVTPNAAVTKVVESLLWVGFKEGAGLIPV